MLSAALSGQSVFNGPRDYIVGSYPDSVIVGDFNEDGLPDVAVANQYSSGISVLLQNSDGTFQLAVNYAVGSQPTSLQTGHVNGDGKLDLVVLNSQDSTISVLLGNGDGTFRAQKVTSIPQFLGVPSLAVGNFNGDSYLDVAIGVPLPQVGTYGVGVLLGNGDGTFQPPVSYPLPAGPIALAAASVSVTGTSATPVTVTVGTPAPGTAGSVSSTDYPTGPRFIAWTLLLLSSSLLFGSKRRRMPALAVTIVILASIALPGCGGGGGPSTQSTAPGTPAGTYTATVTATSGSLSQTVPLTVIVQ